MDNSESANLPPSQKAQLLYERGVQLKKSGDAEAALTEFRRAVLVDPAHFEALLEIGQLCKIKAKVEPVFYRYAFDAFRQAARLNHSHQEAHDSYIMTGQKMGRLDELLIEYEGWLKYSPDNEFLLRCKKNILTISMAMMPDKASIGGGSTGRGKRLIIVGFFALLILGAILGFGLMFLKKGRAHPLPSGFTEVKPVESR